MKAIKYFICILSSVLLSACQNHKDGMSYTGKTSNVSPKITEQKKRIATGFFVTDDGYFLTNYHVIKNAQDIHITTTSGQRVPAVVIYENKDIDIALCKANVRGQAVNWDTRQNVEKGEGVLTIGYPLMVIQGPEQKATFGRINAFSGIHGDPAVYQIDVPVQPGNSGGPLISENGAVIGVIKATFNQMAAIETIGTITQNVNYAIQSDKILPILQQTLGKQVSIHNVGKNHYDMPRLIRKYEKTIVMVEAL